MPHIEGILPKGPYRPCVSMADRALLVGYHRYMCWWTGSALVQIIACRLDGTMSLSQPALAYCQLDPKEHISMKFYSKFKYSYLRKCVWTRRLRNGSHFVRGRWVKPAPFNRTMRMPSSQYRESHLEDEPTLYLHHGNLKIPIPGKIVFIAMS